MHIYKFTSKCYSLLTSKPATMTHSAQTTIPPYQP